MTRNARRLLILAVVVLLTVAVLDLLGTIVLPFALAFGVGALLSPSVDRLHRRGWSRGVAAALLTFSSLAVIGAYAALVLPPILIELGLLVQRLPSLVMAAHKRFLDVLQPLSEAMHAEPPGVEAAAPALDLPGALGHVVVYGLGLVDLVVVLALTPFLLFYFLRDWPVLTETLVRLVPRRQQPLARRLGRRSQRRLDDFLTGQGFVCLILAHLYAAALAFMKIDFGLVLGVLSGLLVMIPVIGIATMALATAAVAALQFSSFAVLLPVLSLFVLAELLNHLVLMPWLVATSHRPHPIWLILTFLIGLQFLGFVGAVMIVPLVCVAEVLIEHLAQEWKRRQKGGIQPVMATAAVTISGSVLQTPVLGPTLAPLAPSHDEAVERGRAASPPKG